MYLTQILNTPDHVEDGCWNEQHSGDQSTQDGLAIPKKRCTLRAKLVSTSPHGELRSLWATEAIAQRPIPSPWYPCLSKSFSRSGLRSSSVQQPIARQTHLPFQTSASRRSMLRLATPENMPLRCKSPLLARTPRRLLGANDRYLPRCYLPCSGNETERKVSVIKKTRNCRDRQSADSESR